MPCWEPDFSLGLLEQDVLGAHAQASTYSEPFQGSLAVRALFSRRVGLISLSRGPQMGFSWVMLVILEHSVCSI
jgi:hypothetical protein